VVSAPALGRGGDPRLLQAELLEVIRSAIRDQPRSQQTRIGPSELGHPCDRWLSHKLRGTPEVNQRSAPWLPTVGTAIHAWLEDVFTADTVPAIAAGGEPRWLLEQRVSVGTIDGQDITGSCDLYDTVTATVVDWKTCGKTRLDKYRRHGPDNDYRVQAHAYGRGWTRKGYDVERVAICFLPRNAELDDTVWWSEPYDEQIAVAALARAEVIAMANTALGDAAPAAMGTVDHNCGYCPWFSLGATDLTRACPGDPSRPKANDSIVSLIAPSDPSTQRQGATQ
jgi:hypothetical protein